MKSPIPLHTVPEKPGVYLMKNSKGLVLYVGKAKNLHARLTTYFVRGGDERVHIPYLLSQVEDVETIVVPSEKEALLLEARLIQQFKPKYNILLKDDKSHLRIYLDLSHDFPRIGMVRIKPGARVPKNSFGPFVSSRYAYSFFDLLVRLFRLRQCTDDEFKRRTRPCLLYQLKRCTAPCVHAISKDEYHVLIREALELLNGKTGEIKKQIKSQMQKASDELDFERASILLKQLHVIEASDEQMKISRVRGIRNCDVIAYFPGDMTSAFCVMQYRDSSLAYSQTILFDTKDSLVELDQLILQWYQRLQHLPVPPSEILLQEDMPYKNALKDILENEFKKTVHIICPQKGPKRELLRLAEENARTSHLQKSSTDDRIQTLLSDVQDQLHLSKLPMTIDCFDVSHLGGKEPVASCVSFRDGRPNKRGYRTLQIQKSESHDDCSMLKEAIERRYRSASELPDLVLIDGGKLQLRTAELALHTSGCIDVDIRSISKEEARHDRGLTSEKIWSANEEDPFILDRTSHVLHFIQRIRDEAHRFAISYQKKKRSQAFLYSELDVIRGIGPQKKKTLLTAFSGIEAIRQATVEDIHTRAKLSLADADRVKRALSSCAD